MRRMFLLTIALGGMLALTACTPSTGTSGPTGPTATGAAATSAAATSAVATGAAPSEATGIDLRVRDFALDPNTVSVTGTTVTLNVTNDGPTIHNVIIRDGSMTELFGTRNLREGESETISGELPPGEYVMFCSLAGHESLGIKGTLTVTAP